MQIKLPGKPKFQQLTRVVYGLGIVSVIGTIASAYLHIWFQFESAIVIFFMVLMLVFFFLALITACITSITGQNKARSLTDYTHLNFTETDVILVHKDFAQSRALPYDKTSLSFAFQTTYSYARGVICYHIAYLTLTFKQEESFTIKLTGPLFITSRTTQQLLDNARRFADFKFSVTPLENPQEKEQQAAAAFIRGQIQDYLNYKTVLMLSEKSRNAILATAWFSGGFSIVILLMTLFLYHLDSSYPKGLSFFFALCWLVVAWAAGYRYSKETRAARQIELAKQKTTEKENSVMLNDNKRWPN